MIKRLKSGDLVNPEDLEWNPQTLYHYTTREGLLGILASRSVWATSIRYLNDTSEYTYAQAAFIEKLSEIRGRVVQAPYAEELDEAIKQLSTLTAHFFVFCLSSAGDLLSQWRAYGRPGNGYSIGFDAPGLDEIAHRGTGLQLAAVSYDPKQQWEMMNHIEIEAVERPRSGSRGKSRAFGRLLCDEFLKWAPFIKDGAFKEEGEWRLVQRLRSAAVSSTKYRSGPSMLVPYVPIRLGTKEQPLPIQRIVVGPSPHPELDKEAVEGLCRSHGVKALIRASAIPYRTW